MWWENPGGENLVGFENSAIFYPTNILLTAFIDHIIIPTMTKVVNANMKQKIHTETFKNITTCTFKRLRHFNYYFGSDRTYKLVTPLIRDLPYKRIWWSQFFPDFSRIPGFFLVGIPDPGIFNFNWDSLTSHMVHGVNFTITVIQLGIRSFRANSIPGTFLGTS